jgi:molecular chaperone GrpE (heat shock protein)
VPATSRRAADIDGAVVENPKIAQLKSQIKDLKDNLLCSHAKQENTRRIATWDATNTKLYVITSFAKSFLNTCNNLSCAFDAVPPNMHDNCNNHPILANLYQGISMTNAGLNKGIREDWPDKIWEQGGEV